ncbi:hypothetical protein D0Z07_8040 [Hyphodiscus hymeniophilus]|uniref:Uncharacterized protein n=1 Tax=Hyphodiscus hymeniophilus TaxID=353542 RepID=A0A9P6SKV6_9HELO|nr:hypothetical protein D0Z07_8040 [Hyphodiscus hymeniophilus]
MTFTEVDKRAAAYGDPIPSYASACTDADQYSSACSCIGVTPSTTTLAATSTTVYTIVTATPTCAGQTCATGFIPSCDQDNTGCYCFTDSVGDGFCGENAPCASLTPCETDDDCTSSPLSSGDTCAFSTCCSDGDEQGLCLVGVCSNPSSNLMKMAMAARNGLVGDTAAFRAQ